MANKQFNVRQIQKHDTEANWDLTDGFIPMDGELIVYDKDATHDKPRIKIGDGVTDVKNLPFSGGGESVPVIRYTKLNDDTIFDSYSCNYSFDEVYTIVTQKAAFVAYVGDPFNSQLLFNNVEYEGDSGMTEEIINIVWSIPDTPNFTINNDTYSSKFLVHYIHKIQGEVDFESCYVKDRRTNFLQIPNNEGFILKSYTYDETGAGAYWTDEGLVPTPHIEGYVLTSYLDSSTGDYHYTWEEPSTSTRAFDEIMLGVDYPNVNTAAVSLFQSFVAAGVAAPGTMITKTASISTSSLLLRILEELDTQVFPVIVITYGDMGIGIVLTSFSGSGNTVVFSGNATIRYYIDNVGWFMITLSLLIAGDGLRIIGSVLPEEVVS